jgi:NTE family protein
MKKVALVLSSGSSRGLAHIGAIEALEERGYTISSVAGCSMGAIVGGMYAAGKLPELKTWFAEMTRKRMLELTDFALNKGFLVKGEKIMEALGELIPEVKIEELAIPLALVATDMNSGNEVVFHSGNLNRAIRASFSIPVVLQPVREGDMLLMDGGIANPLPLNRVERQEGDILVSVNVSAPWTKKEITEMNSLTVLDKVSDVMIQQHGELMKQLCPPDINIDVAMNQFGSFDYNRADEIIRFGHDKMIAAIEAYEQGK